jgi:hypothetical protein
MLPNGCYIDPKLQYSCYCMHFKSDTEAELLNHFTPDGYCQFGLKRVKPYDIHCICGDKFHCTGEAVNHVEIFRCDLKISAYCKKCELQFNSVAHLNRHYTTKRHLKGDGPVIQDLDCKACGITCWSPKRMKAHLQSAKHKQRTEEGTLPLTCDVCNIKCKGQKQMKAHLETNKHRKRCSM